MRCSKCGKETQVICLCGKCNECNGMTKEMEEEQRKEMEKFIEENRYKFEQENEQ